MIRNTSFLLLVKARCPSQIKNTTVLFLHSIGQKTMNVRLKDEVSKRQDSFASWGWESDSSFWAHLQPVPLSTADIRKIYLFTPLQGQGQRSQTRIFLPAAASHHHQPHQLAEPTELTPPSGSIEAGWRVQAKGGNFWHCSVPPTKTWTKLCLGFGRQCNFYVAGKCQQQHNYVYRFRPVHRHIEFKRLSD